jgi:hypothetical protein
MTTPALFTTVATIEVTITSTAEDAADIAERWADTSGAVTEGITGALDGAGHTVAAITLTDDRDWHAAQFPTTTPVDHGEST